MRITCNSECVKLVGYLQSSLRLRSKRPTRILEHHVLLHTGAVLCIGSAQQSSAVAETHPLLRAATLGKHDFEHL